MGYHKNVIPKGVLGEVSKILEEVLELQDAEDQGVRVMALCEASDIVLAVRCYLEKHHPGFTLDDMIKMADRTRSAFEDGTRSARLTPDS